MRNAINLDELYRETTLLNSPVLKGIFVMLVHHCMSTGDFFTSEDLKKLFDFSDEETVEAVHFVLSTQCYLQNEKYHNSYIDKLLSKKKAKRAHARRAGMLGGNKKRDNKRCLEEKEQQKVAIDNESYPQRSENSYNSYPQAVAKMDPESAENVLANATNMLKTGLANATNSTFFDPSNISLSFSLYKTSYSLAEQEKENRKATPTPTPTPTAKVASPNIRSKAKCFMTETWEPSIDCSGILEDNPYLVPTLSEILDKFRKFWLDRANESKGFRNDFDRQWRSWLVNERPPMSAEMPTRQNSVNVAVQNENSACSSISDRAKEVVGILTGADASRTDFKGSRSYASSELEVAYQHDEKRPKTPLNAFDSVHAPDAEKTIAFLQAEIAKPTAKGRESIAALKALTKGRSAVQLE